MANKGNKKVAALGKLAAQALAGQVPGLDLNNEWRTFRAECLPKDIDFRTLLLAQSCFCYAGFLGLKAGVNLVYAAQALAKRSDEPNLKPARKKTPAS